MHEFGVVQSLVQELLVQLKNKEVRKVHSIRFRRGSAFAEEALRQAYVMAAAGTILEGAEILIETEERPFLCACGHQQVITSDELIGHLFVCPKCGRPREIDEAHDLEVVEILGEEG